MRKLSPKKLFSMPKIHLSFFLLQSRQGAELFSWIDAEGSDHFLPGTNCNGNEPTWLMDSVEISDVGVLPVLGIKYGPLLYEEEASKVIIGPIKCQAPTLNSWQEFTMEGQFNNFKTELTNKIIAIQEQSNAAMETKIELLHPPTTSTTAPPLPSQCHNYKQLSDSKRRFDLAKLVPNNQVSCDQLNAPSSYLGKSVDWQGPSWYRVTGQAGTKLSETSYDAYGNKLNGKNRYACNTHHGGWLVGGHPNNPGLSKTGHICFLTSCNGQDKVEIDVTNCNGYFVYNLRDVGYCQSGYCTQ